MFFFLLVKKMIGSDPDIKQIRFQLFKHVWNKVIVHTSKSTFHSKLESQNFTDEAIILVCALWKKYICFSKQKKNI